MAYRTICYLSSIAPDVTKQNLDELMSFTLKMNNFNSITGIFVILKNHFFQVIEGDPERIEIIYNRIKNDTRHTGLIKLIDKSIPKRIFDKYNGHNFIIAENSGDIKKLNIYLDWVKKSDTPEINELLLLTKNFLKYNNE